MSEPPSSEKTQVIGPPAAEPVASRLHQNALPVGTMLGEFEIIDLVGEGGFGIVYLAQDHSLHRKVALKEYMPALLASRGKDASVAVRSERQRETFDLGLRSFVNEARMLAQFDHPALIKVYRFWEAHGTAYMVMPFLSGQTLQDVLRQRDTPSEAWIRGLLSPLMEALTVLHDDQVYHRDIAPDNVMLLPGDRPVLLDFGAARRVISDMTHALTVILKPGYAPIEQYADMPGMKQGPWTDVYALAAVVYFMILKRKPPAAVSRLMEDSYQPLMQSEAAGSYSAALLQGIDRCLRVRAEDRPQSMAAMRDAIDPAEITVGPQPVAGAASEPDLLLDLDGPAPPAAQTVPAARVPAPPAALAPAPPAALAPAPPAALAREPTVAPAPARAAPRAPEPADATEEPIAGFSETDYGARFPPPAPARSRMPMLASIGAAVLLALAAAAYFAGPRPAPAPVPVPVAAVPAAEAPAASAVVAPAASAAPRIASVAAAIDAALAAADPSLSTTLQAPAAAAVGGELKLVAQGKSDGVLYAFVWDRAADRIYRLAADDPGGGQAIKADAGLPLVYRDAVKRAAGEPLGQWRVISMLSERPRDLSAVAFARDGDALVVERSVLEARLAADGLPSLFGKAQCASGEPCPDRFAIGLADVAQQAAPPPAARSAPAPRAPPPPVQGPKAPVAEREYMKRLNKDLDNLLGK